MFAAAGVAATGTYFLLPSGGVAQAVVSVALNAAATVACVRLAKDAPAGAWMWRVLAGSQVIYAAASIGWHFAPLTGAVLPYPSVLDVMYWTSYCGWAAFLVGLAGRQALADPGMAWEGVAGALGLGIVAWPTLLEPALQVAGTTGLQRAASTIYPALLLLLAVMSVRVALGSRGSPVTHGLLVSWLALELATDVWYSVASVNGSFRFGHPWFAGWLLSYTAFGALMLHPDTRTVPTPGLGQWRLHVVLRAGIVWVISAAALAALAVQAPPGRQATANAMAATTAIALSILVGRLALTSRNLTVERGLRAELGRAYDRASYLAAHDSLTSLGNRAAFDEFLPRALARRRGPNRVAGVFMIDLDSFKAVNDTYGHSVGDALLQLTAARLTAATRPADFVGRLGGDEFALVIDDGDVRSLLVLADRLVAAMQAPATLGAVTVGTGVSIGIYASAGDESPQTALIRADAALYAAKAAGGGFEMFDAARHAHFLSRFEIELALRAAARRDELVLHYQPVLDLASRQVVGSEALVRWNHPTRGLLNPGEFIEVAETSGAIVDIGCWVTRQACRDADAWQTLPGGAGVGVAVNLSRRQMQSPTVVDDARDALDSVELDPGLVTFEITETALMADTTEMVARLDKIKAIGVDLAMDDFGTGYSSLSHLRSLPIDLLKIDKAFIDGIAKDDEEWALASAIIGLATSLGKRTLAEGIEHPSQLAHLRSLGCELGQGWLFAPAMPLEEFTAFLGRAPGRPRTGIGTINPP